MQGNCGTPLVCNQKNCTRAYNSMWDARGTDSDVSSGVCLLSVTRVLVMRLADPASLKPAL